MSVDKELRPTIKWLKSLEIVDKIVIGYCESARHAYTPGTVRYRMDAPGGIKANAYGGRGVVDLYIKVSDDNRDELLQLIREKWTCHQG